ncbi:hypothetical protein AGABI1DRAFT_104172 [Agaricus bisporus var. burnettii JB137-S8]|uniref:25S rRNA (uridine-N(3))-methyltransferase BMT5-like domain-containing protein n=1 Tax=Agaricus bisporus var. burnettii (strain JB137-S8 / ATCC MYA-4627 / FGSC 10392) TaxID=597362 RepID=K5XL02_AGABU|nr:uncharacterized protein AGABI1DRAFT_104172 [Agaricus bisporus var. burnettii JB137-S8]EKM84228.1 hypothetical protein AGABI1DRAFT_104172 [Agaricus bisporus var. burnettii JB137-S8]
MGKGLKAALKSQQTRLKEKEKAQKAARAADLKYKKTTTYASSAKSKAKEKLLSNQKPTIPFLPSDDILLVGEGNFSFARALAFHPPSGSGLEDLPPQNITATAYDSEEECFVKYPEAKDIVQNLRERGVEVLFNIDATKLDKISGVKGRKWDRVVWNFPHAGKGITDQDRNILSNQVLVLDFLRSAAKVLRDGLIPSIHKPKRKPVEAADESEDEGVPNPDDMNEAPSNSKARGTVLITLRNVPPYTLWEVPRLAKKPPLPKTGSKFVNPQYIQLRSFAFHRNAWRSYEHRMTKGERAHGVGKTGEGGEDRTWEFCLRD